VFELFAIAIFGPMIFALLWVLARVASQEALARLRASSFFKSALRIKKKTEQNGCERNFQIEGRKKLPSPLPEGTEAKRLPGILLRALKTKPTGYRQR
jgi:hypothetical protein